jgi:hypothetical protein
MGVIKNRIFFHHADTSVLGGHFTHPVNEALPVQVPLSLAPSGGTGKASTDHFSFHGLISFTSAKSEVSGTYDATKKIWRTEAKVTIKGLNIRGRVTAKLIVSQMVTEHPEVAGEYEPSVTLAGSTIEGLKIDGKPFTVNLDPNFLKNQPTLPLPAKKSGAPKRRPLIANKNFLSVVKKQYVDIVREHKGALAKGTAASTDDNGNVSGWVANRYPSASVSAKINQRGAVLCSMVKTIKGTFPGAGAVYGNIVEVPNLGRLFFGEILVDRNTHRLIMLRAELGSTASGNASAGTASIEGRPWP